MKRIVYPRTVNYDHMYQRPQQILRALSKLKYETIYINLDLDTKRYPGSRNYSKATRIEANHYVYPFHTNIRDLDPDIIYYTFPPHRGHLSEFFGKIPVIFDSIDEPVGVFELWDRDGYYKKSLEDADIILASSKKLYNIAKRVRDDVYLVPNGCDYEYFSTKHVSHPDLNVFDGPIITYTGTLASWVDFNLIIRIATAHPDWNIVLVGTVLDRRLIRNLRRFGNIHQMGHYPYQDVASFLYGSDVLIIPFKSDDPVIEATNPIKLWEYLATGKPIVATNIPECNVGGVYVSDDRFIDNIEKGLNEKDKKLEIKRKNIAKENSWLNRAKVIVEALRD